MRTSGINIFHQIYQKFYVLHQFIAYCRKSTLHSRLHIVDLHVYHDILFNIYNIITSLKLKHYYCKLLYSKFTYVRIIRRL